MNASLFLIMPILFIFCPCSYNIDNVIKIRFQFVFLIVFLFTLFFKVLALNQSSFFFLILAEAFAYSSVNFRNLYCKSSSFAWEFLLKLLKLLVTVISFFTIRSFFESGIFDGDLSVDTADNISMLITNSCRQLKIKISSSWIGRNGFVKMLCFELQNF